MKIIKILQNTALISDGMAIIQQQADHVQVTFSDLNIYIYRSKFLPFTCPQELILYVINTILWALKILNEDSVRIPLATCCLHLMRMRKHLSKFFMSVKNKNSHVLFMVTHWKELAPEEFHGKIVFGSLSQGCFMLSTQNDTNEVITETWQELTTDYEKADTFLLLHAKHALTVSPQQVPVV